MTSEGNHEIEAARQRLAAAKARAASAAEAVERAEATLGAAEEEVNAAETCLVNAEWRWEATGAASDGDKPPPVAERHAKRRKVSLGSEVCALPNDGVGDASVGGTPAGIPRRSTKGGAGSDASQIEAHDSTRKVCTSLKRDHWGKTVGNVDGIYQRVEDDVKGGVSIYRKEGLWSGEPVDFVLYRESCDGGDGRTTRCWFIGVSGYASLFKTSSSGEHSDSPPVDGWITTDELEFTPLLKDAIIPLCLGACSVTSGVTSPAMDVMIEEIKAIEEETRRVARVVVEGSGMPDINGTYTRAFEIVGGVRRTAKLHDGVPVFGKRGRWEGRAVNFALFRRERDEQHFWCIGTKGSGPVFQARDDFYAVGPPDEGWHAIGRGVNPGPKLRVIL